MADSKISALTAIDAVAGGDEFAVNDISALASRKATTTQVIAAIPTASDTVTGTIKIADVAAMETGTNVADAVVPGRQHRHVSAAKCWLKCGVAADIKASYNITSLTDTGAGQVTVTIATDFSSTNWSCQATVEFTSTTLIKGIHGTSQAAGSILLVSVTEAGSAADPTNYWMAGFGDHV